MAQSSPHEEISETERHRRLDVIFEQIGENYPTLPKSLSTQKSSLEKQRKQIIFEAFEYFDTDHNGTLDPGEIKFAMQLLGFPLTKQEIADFVEKDGEDDAVSFDVFSNFVLDKMSKVPPEEESLRAFRLIDKDHRGFIEYKSLKRAATDCNSDLAYAPDILKSIISSIDKDGDNRLSYEEFERAYMKSLE